MLLIWNPLFIFFLSGCYGMVNRVGADMVLVCDSHCRHEAGWLNGQGADSGIQGSILTNSYCP